MKQKPAIIIPTYNASSTIIKLIKEILVNIPDANIIIVDDNSPDKTYEIIEKTLYHTGRVSLLLRKEKGGRGSAVLAGFHKALQDPLVTCVIEMDADFFHNPSDLGNMIAGLQNADVVIGSRYLRSSKIVGWLWYRKMFSKAANMWARFILGIPITDYTNGFRCYNKKAVAVLLKNTYKGKGFIVLSEMAYLLYKKKFRFTEKPIAVSFNRSLGSNFSLHEITEAFWALLKIRFP